jgi:copper resistance protein C
MTYRPRAVALGVLVAGVALTGAIPAAAHNELVGSTPADGATVTAAPQEVVLEFDQPVQAPFSQVAVLDTADGHHEHGDPLIDGGTITQRMDDLVPGAYRISYRIGSADGHPITGTVTFTVATPATSTETTTSEPSPEVVTPAAATGASDQASNTMSLLIAGGLVVVVLGAVVYVMFGRRRETETGQQ